LSSRRREVQYGVGEPIGHIAFGVRQEVRVHEKRDCGIGMARYFPPKTKAVATVEKLRDKLRNEKYAHRT
jgi:hypothetical protein